MTRASDPNLSLGAKDSRSLFSMLAIATLSRLLKKGPKEKLTAEVLGGIEFIQVRSLSTSQKKLFWRSSISKKIITILRGKDLLYDCLPYKDYCDWFINLEK